MATSKGNAGFFSKDKDYGLRMDEHFDQGEQWLALSCKRDTPFVDKDGKQIQRTAFEARKLDPDTLKPYGLPVTVKTLSAPIYENAGDVADDDFPCVVCWDRVEVKKYGNEATIIRHISVWPIPAEYLDTLGM